MNTHAKIGAMATKIMWAACTAICLYAVPAWPQNATSLRSTIEAHYRAINGEQSEVRDAEDLVIITGHHLPDYTLFPWHGGLLREAGWRDAAKRMGADVEFQGAANLRMTNFRAQIYDNVGLATFYLVGTVGGQSVTNRVSAVWVHADGVWREAHHHESPLQPDIDQ